MPNFIVSCAVLGGGAAFFAARRHFLAPYGAAFVGLLSLVLGVFLAISTKRRPAPLTRRIVEISGEKAALPPSRRPARRHAFGDAARRVLRASVPSLSGQATVGILVGCFVVTALLVPASLHLPKFVEVEAVVASWWAILGVILSVLLYRGFRIGDDYRLALHPLSFKRDEKTGGKEFGNSLADGCIDVGCVDVDGCATVLLVIALSVISVLASWLLVDVVFPILFVLVYAILRRALARVANDDHDCRGHLARTFVWATWWSTAYTAPLATVVWIVHRSAHWF